MRLIETSASGGDATKLDSYLDPVPFSNAIRSLRRVSLTPRKGQLLCPKKRTISRFLVPLACRKALFTFTQVAENMYPTAPFSLSCKVGILRAWSPMTILRNWGAVFVRWSSLVVRSIGGTE